MSLFRKRKLTTFQMIAILYFLAVGMSTLLLSLPIGHKEGVDLSFVDILFTAVSAISVTGLSVINISESFNMIGILIMTLIFQIGALGVMAIGTFIWIVTKQKIGLRERQLMMADQNRNVLAGMVHFIKEIFLILISIELAGTIILGIYFLRFYPSIPEAFYHSFFVAVSATTNAGFDLTGESLIPFAHDYFVQSVTILLMLSGAIGFPVLVEIKKWFRSKNKRFQFSLYTKVTTITYFVLFLIGVLFILLLEWNRFFADKNWHETLFFSLFQSTTARSAGFTTMDINHFSDSTLMLISLLMFIGASPSSAGGGIRTTTLALILIGTYAYARGRATVKMFKREIYHEDITKAYSVVTVAVLLVVISFFILTISEELPLIAIFFEVCSAFGTTGASLGITPDFSTFGKFVLMLLMFIGRIGIVSFLFMIRKEKEVERYHYAKEHIIIG